jgi:hypothetical protein
MRTPSRRLALGGLLAAGAGLLLPRQAHAQAAAPRRNRGLELASTHTGQVLSVAYRGASGLVDDAVLHERSSGVAVRSLHLEGRAIDVRLRHRILDADSAMAERTQR